MSASGSAGLAAENVADLRVAIAHEWLDAPGGAENVVREMLRVFPDADLWSLWCLSPAKDAMPEGVQTSWLAKSPLAGRKVAALPLMPLAWRTLPRRDYDVVITSTYALAHTARFRGRTGPTLHYVHTPARYWWAPDVDGRGSSLVAALPRSVLRALDRQLTRSYRHVAANSDATRDRIRRFWGLDARVIHPPVDTEFYTPGGLQTDPPFGEYVLGVSRWVAYKRLDLVIRTAEQAGLPAVIAGSGPMEAELRDLARSAKVPVHFEVQPDRTRLRDLYRGATALVFAVHEDFGIVPVEAMACGTPVVGKAVGGLLESVTEGVSGTLVEQADPSSLAKALGRVETLPRDAVASTAGRFSSANFRQRFATWTLESIRDG